MDTAGFFIYFGLPTFFIMLCMTAAGWASSARKLMFTEKLSEASRKKKAAPAAAPAVATPAGPAGPVAVPAGKKPPVRAVEPAPAAAGQKRGGKKAAG